MGRYVPESQGIADKHIKQLEDLESKNKKKIVVKVVNSAHAHADENHSGVQVGLSIPVILVSRGTHCARK